jgi:hypothetical protein
MQFEARFIEFATALPRPIAATAMAAPTMARISAYSAAAAPESSFSMLMNFVIFRPLYSCDDARPGIDFRVAIEMQLVREQDKSSQEQWHPASLERISSRSALPGLRLA